MSETTKDPEILEAGTAIADADHDAWFRDQVEVGLKEAKQDPESCAPLEEVLKDLDL